MELDILTKFLESNLNLHPLALEELKKMDEREIDRILAEIRKSETKVVTLEDIENFKEPKVKVLRPRKKAIAEEYEPDMRIRSEGDITKRSFSEGDINDFIKYFNDRFEKISRILREREQLRDATSIDWAKKKKGELKIIGMVSEIRRSKKGHLILEVEDPTGTMPVLISNRNQEMLHISRSILKDEIIGVIGREWNGMVIASDILFPNLPTNRERKNSEVPVAVAMISDIHLGSSKFLEEVFSKFIKWMKGELGSTKHKSLSERTKYLIIGGDLVDGVGIYPGQEKELKIKDVVQQYRKIAEYLEEIPDYVEIIIIPGNHDATRQAEPQPAISEEFAPELYDDPRIHMTGNPCSVTLHGIELLIYHGRSLDDIISTLPDQSYSKPEKAMLELLKKRHLAPVYGGKVPIAPEPIDYMTIENPPDIIHFGHAHHYAWAQYRGVTLINSGTFQDQTSFQRKLNMVPTPGKVPIFDLMENKTIKMEFG